MVRNVNSRWETFNKHKIIMIIIIIKSGWKKYEPKIIKPHSSSYLSCCCSSSCARYSFRAFSASSSASNRRRMASASTSRASRPSLYSIWESISYSFLTVLVTLCSTIGQVWISSDKKVFFLFLFFCKYTSINDHNIIHRRLTHFFFAVCILSAHEFFGFYPLYHSHYGAFESLHQCNLQWVSCLKSWSCLSSLRLFRASPSTVEKNECDCHSMHPFPHLKVWHEYLHTPYWHI